MAKEIVWSGFACIERCFADLAVALKRPHTGAIPPVLSDRFSSPSFAEWQTKCKIYRTGIGVSLL